MPRFKIGDNVKCLPIQPKAKSNHQGAGFIAGMTFEVRKITETNTNDAIYWPDHGNGIYEHELEGMDWDV